MQERLIKWTESRRAEESVQNIGRAEQSVRRVQIKIPKVYRVCLSEVGMLYVMTTNINCIARKPGENIASGCW